MNIEPLSYDDPNVVFVFGSNLSGIHGAGAARAAAVQWGAKWGVGEGLTGRSYALPTKGKHLTFMEPAQIQLHVNKFILLADIMFDNKFMVTQVGCGLAGFDPQIMAFMFELALENCYFDTAWHQYLGDDYKYWGHV